MSLVLQKNLYNNDTTTSVTGYRVGRTGSFIFLTHSNFPTKFQQTTANFTPEIMTAQTFNFAPKLPQNWEFSTSSFTFLGKNFQTRRFLDNFWTAQNLEVPGNCHDVTKLNITQYPTKNNPLYINCHIFATLWVIFKSFQRQTPEKICHKVSFHFPPCPNVRNLFLWNTNYRSIVNVSAE